MTADGRSRDRFAVALADRLARDRIVVLEPIPAETSLPLLAATTEGRVRADGPAARPACVMLDPWYNKGVGGVRDDYVEFISGLLRQAACLAPHTYLWGFPEIVARFVDRLPDGLELGAWLTWYYKNNPSVIRGWRSAQMTCLHLTRPDAVMHPEAFMNDAQRARQAAGKLRYLPGPPSVIEAALLVGFVGRAEQTGHPSQKPEAVYDPLLRMATITRDLVIDPMCGSGTTGAVARSLDRRAILADVDPDYVAMTAARLGVDPLPVPVPRSS